MTPFAAGLTAQRSTLRQEALALVKHALLAGEFKPGRVLSANAIATELGVSNSPVREALMDLVGQGLLEVVKNRGFRVRENTEDDRREIHEMRSILEVSAMQRLARRGLTAEESARARELCEGSLAPDRVDGRTNTVAYLDADHEMHVYLVGLLGNSRLTAMVERLRDQTRVGGALVDLPREQVTWYSSEHAALIDAIEARDETTVGRLMQRHLDAVHEHVADDPTD
ncbi:GntR family transcriptional regulator [Brevibacterium samyangense]|uniref:GntR family transcriptional regulator n=1 Tax=Brevibacterium samyangense TaxID=366888 RepID=A0ABN2T563_9MICO